MLRKIWNGGTLGAAICTAAALLTGCTALGGDEGGWKAMPLLDDNSDPDTPGWHEGRSLVTGVRFTALDHGVVVVAADNGVQTGGAIFGARAEEVTGFLFAERDSICSTGAYDFHGLMDTPNGMVALTDACALVASHDGGRTFTATRMGTGGDPIGIEKALALRVTGAGSVIVRDTGVVARTPGVPGESAVWTDIWAPGAIPPIPSEVPADQCQQGPTSDNVPVEHQAAYIGPDGSFIAYVNNPGEQYPEICFSRDGGSSFYPVPLEGTAVAPTGVLFTSEQVGLTWYSNTFAAADTYIRRSTDGGATWTDVMPAALAGVRLRLHQMFFAPGNTVGYLVGYNLDNRTPLLLKTKDGGASFAVIESGLADALPDVELHTGFALDDKHLWVGGSLGGLAYSSTGGE